MKRILFLSAMALWLFAAAGCEEENDKSNTPRFGLKELAYTGCKHNEKNDHKKQEEYIEYKGDKDGYLYIRHVNATFNCCPDTIKATAFISDARITIKEDEINPVCNCVCQYDLTYRIGPLSSRKYMLAINRGNREYTMFEFIYNSSLNGKFFIQRPKEIIGMWELRQIQQGFSPDLNYKSKEIVCIFNPDGLIEIKSMLTSFPFMEKGVYTYFMIPGNKSKISINNKPYDYVLNNKQLIISDEPYLDGPVFKFNRITESN